MNKDILPNVDVGARRELASVIKEHISKDRLAAALSIPDKRRYDAINHIVVDAVKNSPLVSFSGVPHVFSPRKGMYVPFDYHEFKSAIDESMRRSNIPDGNYSKIGKIVSDCWSEVQCRKGSVDTSIVVMENGVFDTMDMRLHDYNERYMTNMRVNYSYNESEYPVMWKRFLADVLPDHEMQDLLQEFLAATFVDRKYAKIEYMLSLLGSGSNGKSVVFEVVMALLGEENVSTFSIRDLVCSARSAQNIAMCNGKRLNYCSEMRTTSIGEDNSDAFKAIVSGETVMARSLYREPFKASSIPLIMSNANKMPKLGDASFSMQRRVLIIPFETYIPDEKQDLELSAKLKEELPGIFNWIMEGLIRLRNNKYQITVPDRVRKLVSEYLKDNNPVTRWIDERGFSHKYIPGTSAQSTWSKTSSLFRNFDMWCIENHEAKISSRKFSESLDALGFCRSRRSEGYGYSFYTVPTSEDILAANMDLAIAKQSGAFVEAIKAATATQGTVRVTGVEEVERYLGLPAGIIWEYIKNGVLEGTFSRVGNGKSVFDVRAVQKALAQTGFYSELDADEDAVRKRATKAAGGMRRAFNERMKAIGVPIRKYGDANGVVPKNFAGCWIVPDEWEYSKKAAEIVMSNGSPIPSINQQ